MMISRSGDILEISTSMYLYIFYKNMPDLQVINITLHTLMTTHEIVRDLASFKMYIKNVLPMHPSDQPAPAVTLTHRK